MKNYFAVILLFSFSAYSQTPDCDQEDNLSKIAKGITYPNCNTPSNVQAFKSRDKSKLCGACKGEFELVHGKISENKNHIQDEFLSSALNEYKKNITNNLLNSIKMKVLYSTGVKFEKSIKSCKMQTASDFAKSCKSATAVKLLGQTSFFDDLSKELSNDVAKFLTTDPAFNPKPTLLQRSEQKCSIPEKDILLMSASSYEEALNEKLIEAIKRFDPKKFKTVSDMFSSDEFLDNYDGDIAELKDSLYNHPLFASHLSSPEKFVSFFKSVPSPASVENLRKALYSKANGENFDSDLAKSCETSAKVLKDAICSDSFEGGNLFIDPANNFDKLKISMDRPSEETLASSEKLVDNNIKLLELCENQNSTNKKSLSLINSEIGVALTENQKTLNLDLFKTEKYNSELGSLTSSLCAMTEATCTSGTISCSIFKKLQDRKKNGTAASKLAESSNNEVNALLRSMIGDTSKLDSKTKDILIAQGIIPKDNGEIVAQADVERKPEALPLPNNQQQNSSATLANSKAGTPTNVANSAKTGRNPSSESSTLDEGYSNTNTKSTSNTLPDFSDLMDDQQELRGIQDEIKRRLLGMPENKPANMNEAKKIARDSFKARGKKISPEMEDAFATRMMQQPDAQSSQTANANSILPNANSENRAGVSGGESANAKWRKGQDQAALMGMKGAQDALSKDSAGTTGANDAKPKDMTKVALNLADDPRVTLSDMFNKKIDQNDPETQLLKVLLRNKNNFLLQVKSMNFKIIFDEKNNFNLLLESGDRQEAARIRPQLEMFLKKLKT